LKLLEKEGIDLVIALPFDQTLATQAYDTFFKTLHSHLPFHHLIVGSDARFGKERLGGPQEIATLNLFQTTYLDKEALHKETISSNTIRSHLENGELKKVKKMLGRPYSLSLPFDSLNVVRQDEVQYQWVTGAENIALLPSAVYAVDLQTSGKKIPAIAFYRGYQTISKEKTFSLTLIFEKELPPSDTIEITFLSYLHDELDSSAPKPSKINLLKSLKPEFIPS
ncbi:MAG: hypothetical protein KDK71_05640, partial [Chlamydiia bacterium]|nr:hypothetical protein [Chlamydiia bacterium]